MRVSLIVGLLLVAAGVFIWLRAPSYTQDKTAFKIGSLEAKVSEEHTIPGWVGGVAVAAGVVVIAVGARGRKV